MLIQEGCIRLERNIDNNKSIIKFPSHKYPLNSTPEIFDFRCTEDISDDKVIQIVNSAEFNIGRCYTNAEKLANKLCSAGYDAKCYVGWFFPNDPEPIHHAFVILDGVHVIDLSVERDFAELEQSLYKEMRTLKETRYKYAKILTERREKLHSTHVVVGKVPDKALYIGCPCGATEGIKIYNKLIKAFPKHPCNCTDNGVTNETQRLLMQLSKNRS